MKLFLLCSAKVTNDQGIVHVFYAKSTVMRLNRKLSFDEIQLACVYFVKLILLII